MQIAYVAPRTGSYYELEYITHVVRHLSADHSITVFTSEGASLAFPQVTPELKLIELPAQLSDEEYFTQVTERILRGRNYDILHVEDSPLWAFKLVQLVKASNRKTRVVLGGHASTCEKLRHLPEVESKTILSSFNAVVADSTFTLSLLRSMGYTTRAERIYPGVDCDRFEPWYSSGKSKRESMRRSLGLNGKKVLILVAPEKTSAVSILHEAFRLLFRKDSNYHLLAVDFTQPEGTCHHPNVTVTGASPANLPKYYAASDVALCPVTRDSAGAFSALQAMACGLPVIAAFQGALLEIVVNMETGILIPDGNSPRTWATAIQSLLSHPDLVMQYGRLGRTWACETFTWSRTAAHLEALYRGL